MANWNRDDSDLAVTTGVSSTSVGNVRITGNTIGLSSDTDILTLADNTLTVTATTGAILKNSDLILKNSGDSTTITLDASSGAITGSTLDVSTLTVSGAQTYSSLLTATSGLKLGNNIIYNSQGEQTLTLDNDMNLTCENNLTVDGTATVTGTTTLGSVNTGLVTATDSTGFKAVNPSDASVYGTMGPAAFQFSGDTMSTILSAHDIRICSGDNKKIRFYESLAEQFHFDMTDHILMVGSSGKNYTLDIDGSVEVNSDAGSFAFMDASANLFSISSSGNIRAFGAATIDGSLTLGTALADSNISSASAWNAKLDSAGTIASDDFARFDSNGDLVGRSYAEVRSDLGISDAEIIDWTSDQGGTNIHADNYGDINASAIVASGLTTSAGLKLSNNIIYASDGDTAITLDTDSNVIVAGTLEIDGNAIKASDGGTAITMDTSDNVGIGNDLIVGGELEIDGNVIRAADAGTCITMDNDSNVAIAGDLTVTGNDIKSSSATAITLSGADISVAGDLTVTGDNISGSNGNVIEFLSNNTATFANNVNLNSDLSRLKFGVDTEVMFEHLHNEGLKLTANSALTNSVNRMLQLAHTTSGTAANNIGLGIEFQQEIAGGSAPAMGAIDLIVSDATWNSGNADFVFKLMHDGVSAAEKMKITSAGVLTTSGNVNGASPTEMGYLSGVSSAIQTQLDSKSDINVNVANLTARLPQITESVTIGDATDVNVTVAGDLVVAGNNIGNSGTSDIITFSSNNVKLANWLYLETENSIITFGASNQLVLGHNATSKGFTMQSTSDITNTANESLTIQHKTSGTAANGIGVGIKFNTETANAHYEDGGFFNCVATDVSSGSEDFKFEWLLMAGGSAATERMTLDSLGNLAIDGDLTMGDDLKLSANANDYATLSVADTGDLTIATTGDGTTDSDIILDSDGDIFLDAAGADIKFQVGGTSYLEWAATGALTMKSVIDTGDVATITCGTHGAMMLATTDDDAAAGHITIDADGDVILDSETGNFIAKKSGTEFSSANSSYAGMILGYTCINDYVNHYLETSFTVEDAGHKVTFTVPPSGNVEIEFTGFFDRTSTSDVTVYAGLSDSSTYNSVGNTHEYDYGGVKADDEIDDELITWKWCVSGLTAGASVTYYLGLKSSDATAVQMRYGYRSANGLAFPPFIMKATALPSTIYDGS